MPSSNRRRATAVGVLAAATLTVGGSSPARAQQLAQGFAVDRFYQSAPGGGWFVMDALDMRGGLGASLVVSTGYAHDSLRVTDGLRQLTVVSDQAFCRFA